MKSKITTALVGILGMSMAGAEMRVFTNKEGKTLEAELLSVEENKAVLKLGTGKQAKVVIGTLSETDQDFIRKWWEENKDKIRPTDVILTLERKESKMRRNKSNYYDEKTGHQNSSSSKTYDLHFAGEFRNNAGNHCYTECRGKGVPEGARARQPARFDQGSGEKVAAARLKDRHWIGT